MMHRRHFEGRHLVFYGIQLLETAYHFLIQHSTFGNCILFSYTASNFWKLHIIFLYCILVLETGYHFLILHSTFGNCISFSYTAFSFGNCISFSYNAFKFWKLHIIFLQLYVISFFETTYHRNFQRSIHEFT